MDFYSALSRYYDEIFPANADEMSFLIDQFKGKNSLLDIGCGTGNKTVHFCAAGRTITGIDGDPGMIAASDAHKSEGIEYRIMDMLSLGQEFEKGTFDGILCLGNSLAHLTSPETISVQIKDMAELLKDDGVAAIQILNYDRILYFKISDLPPLETEKLLFTRHYKHEKNLLRFQTSLLIKESGEKEENDIPLYPLRKEELDLMLLRAGFRKIAYYGSYQGARLNGESFVLLALAQK